MLSGMHGFAKTQLSMDEVFRLVEECAYEYGALRFELFQGDTMKTRKTRRWDKAKKSVFAGTLSSITALSARNERNGVEIDLSGHPNCYLPYEIHATKEITENEVSDMERFFDSVVLLSKCDYAFAAFRKIYGNHMTYRMECVTSILAGAGRPDARALLLVSSVNLKCLYKETTLGKNHYSQGKRMREIAKKQKQEEKKERKLARQNPQPGENAAAPDENAPPAAMTAQG